jgi:hypothetical protein
MKSHQHRRRHPAGPALVGPQWEHRDLAADEHGKDGEQRQPRPAGECASVAARGVTIVPHSEQRMNAPGARPPKGAAEPALAFSSAHTPHDSPSAASCFHARARRRRLHKPLCLRPSSTAGVACGPRSYQHRGQRLRPRARSPLRHQTSPRERDHAQHHQHQVVDPGVQVGHGELYGLARAGRIGVSRVGRGNGRLAPAHHSPLIADHSPFPTRLPPLSPSSASSPLSYLLFRPWRSVPPHSAPAALSPRVNSKGAKELEGLEGRAARNGRTPRSQRDGTEDEKRTRSGNRSPFANHRAPCVKNNTARE